MRAVSAVVLLFSAALALQCAQPDRYSYAKRSTGVLEVHFLSATSMKTVQFTVFGDGCVRGKVVGTGPDRRLLDEFEARLSEERVRDLVEDAVSSGLAEFEPREFIRELREGGQLVPHTTDGGEVFFRIQLDYLDGGAGALARPFEHSFLAANPDDSTRVFPGIEQFAALQRITAALDDIYWAHQNQERPRTGRQ